MQNNTPLSSILRINPLYGLTFTGKQLFGSDIDSDGLADCFYFLMGSLYDPLSKSIFLVFGYDGMHSPSTNDLPDPIFVNPCHLSPDIRAQVENRGVPLKISLFDF